MRSPDAIERLAAAGPALPGFLADAGEEDRILARILASDRSPARAARRRRTALVLAGVALLAAVGAGVSLEIGRGSRPLAIRTGGHQHAALTGARLELAGYRFRTPAGFKQSSSSCISAPLPGEPRPAIDGFAAAASADGACLQAAYLIADQSLQGPADAQPVDVGQYHGYYVSQTQGAGGQSSLFVDLPKAGGDRYDVSLLLVAQGVTEDELIAIAESGLPTLPPPGPTPTTGTESSG